MQIRQGHIHNNAQINSFWDFWNLSKKSHCFQICAIFFVFQFYEQLGYALMMQTWGHIQNKLETDGFYDIWKLGNYIILRLWPGEEGEMAPLRKNGVISLYRNNAIFLKIESTLGNTRNPPLTRWRSWPASRAVFADPSSTCSEVPIYRHNRNTETKIPSGGLTLIVWTQKWGFSCKVQRQPPADMFLNESLPPKTPLQTPCSLPPWPWFSCEKSLKIFKVP
jgi:hypothetical protein